MKRRRVRIIDTVKTGEGWAEKFPTVHSAYWLWRAVAAGVVK